MFRIRELFCLLALAPGAFGFAKLSDETAGAFDRYVQTAESQMSQDLQPGRFLQVDSRSDWKAKLRAGQVLIESASGFAGRSDAKIPGGLLQDWLGMMFIPGGTIQQAKTVLQDYANYKNVYQPEVVDSKELSHHLAHNDDQYDIFLRLYEKYVLTVVLNAQYHVEYGRLDERRMYVNSHSTRIAEAKESEGPSGAEEPVGDDSGFLWRLNSYWRFEEADGGLYAECEAISLSRDVPFGLGFMLKGFLEKFPKESMANTLRGTRAAVQARRTKQF